MSLVGTRPILQEELRQYELHHRARIAIKPGITGMWQVSGRSDISSVAEQICASPLMDYVRSSRNSFRWRSTMHFFFSAAVDATVSKLF